MFETWLSLYNNLDMLAANQFDWLNRKITNEPNKTTITIPLSHYKAGRPLSAGGRYV